MFINEYPDKIPFDALRYLAGECNYGGRVTDDKDRRCMEMIMENFYTPEIFDDNYKFSPSGIYFAPKFTDYNGYIKYLKDLPAISEPEIFGLHSNANITKNMNETNMTFNAILTTQQNSTGGGGSDEDEKINKICDSILKDVPQPFDVKKAEEKYPV